MLFSRPMFLRSFLGSNSLIQTAFHWLAVLAITGAITATSSLQAQDPPEADAATAKSITGLPEVDRAIHDAMQSRSYGDAVKLIETELGKADVTAPDYLRYLQGVAHTEAEQYDAAIEAFEKLEKEHADGPWVSRSRFGRAHVYVLKRQYIDAGAIYQSEAERLLSRGRKDDLAKIYLEFADRYFDGIPAADPAQVKKPDYKQALTYYSEAVKLGPTVPLRQKIDFRIARCQDELRQHDPAIAAYKKFLEQYGGESPKSGTNASDLMQVESGYRMGAVQLNAGRRAAARKTWQDLLTKWDGKDLPDPDDVAKDDAKEEADDQTKDSASSFLSRAEYRLSHTYGLPSPNSIGDLELGVAVAEKFLENHPDHELAPKAELEIAQGFTRHGRHAKATKRLQSLIDNPNYAESDQIPVARQMLGKTLLAQGKFDEAITAWKAFLEKHPTDPKWSTVQKQIVDSEYAKALNARSKEKFADARTMWQTFLNKYPLDSRAPSVLMQFGQMKFAEAVGKHRERVTVALEKGDSAQSVQTNDECKQLYEEAIVDWRRVVAKYPSSNEASHASYMIGITLEDKLGKLKEALDSYKNVKGQFASKASQRTKRLTSPQLIVMTERKFRSNEKPRIKLTTRNLKNVTVKAYRVDMIDYFRKMHLASGVETLDIALIDPDEQFVHEVKEYGEYLRIDDDIELPINEPGVTAVTVTSDKLEATTMVVVSDLDMVVKSSRNEMFLFVENMLTGKPVPGASVLISDGSEVFAEEITGENGVLQKNFDELKSVRDLRVFAVQQGHMASTVNNLNGLGFAVGLTPRGYLYTDRPAYRKGQLVNIKGIVRWVDQDRFTFKDGEKFKLDVYDARGRQLQSKEVALNAFGTVNSNLILPESAPQGDYRIHLHRASSGESDAVGALSFETRFKVTEYKLEPVQIKIDLDKRVYFRGDKIKATVALQYYYGTPLADETIQYKFASDGETIKAQTDGEGKVHLEFETQRFSEAQPLTLSVSYPDRGVNASETAYLATRGFAVSASTMRNVFINGESFETEFGVADPAGKPIETKLKVEVFKQTVVRRTVGEKLVQSHEVTTDKELGKAQQVLTLDEAGVYFVRATGEDQFGNEVSGQTVVRISGDKDATRLRILADQFSYKVGDDAKVKLHWREKPALALVTFEGASVLGYKLVELKEGLNELDLPMESAFAPNFFLSVAVMHRNKIHNAQTEFRVARQLNVALKVNQNELKPGDDLSVEIQVTDPQGNPVKAEVSLALIQTNLLNMFADVQGAVNTFFGTGNRTTSVRQSTSCTFSYKPKTRGVSQFLLAEADRRATLEREVRALADAYGPVAIPAAPVEEFFADDSAELERYANMQPESFNQAIALGGVISGGYAGQGYGNEGFGGAMGGGAHINMGDGAVPFMGQTQQNYSVTVPYTEQVQQSYTVQVPVQSTRTEQYTVTVPYTEMQTVIRNGREVQVPVQRTRQETRTREVPVTTMATQTKTRMVPVQKTRQEYRQRGRQNYAVQVPIAGTTIGPVPELGQIILKGNKQDVLRVQNMIDAAQLGFGVAGPGPGIVASPNKPQNQWRTQWLSSRDLTVNGLNRKGQFLVVNGQGKEQVRQMIREDGLQILPAMTHAETAFWDPTIVTDDTGKALVTITMPARSTAWRLRAKGVNGETLTGEDSADVVTKKDLFGEMKLPMAFTVGDQAVVPVEIHNSLDGARKINVKLKATLGDKSTEQSKDVDVQGPGITKVQFPIEIESAEQAIFELAVSGGGDLVDNTNDAVLVRPFGFPVYQTASGTSSQSTLAMIDFDETIQANDPSLEIVIGSSMNRSLLESVTGGSSFPVFRCGLPSSNPIERSISDAIGGVGLLKMIGAARDTDAPEGQAIAGRITSAVSQLVSTQMDNGGWSWTGALKSKSADPFLSSRAMWALSVARDAGFSVPESSFASGQAFMKKSFASASQSDLERQTVLLHAMAVSGCGDFSFANRLYRERNRLSPSGLTHLALTLTAMNHKEMAAELIDLIKVPMDGKPLSAEARKKILPWMRNHVELQAMYMLALQEIAPAHGDNAKLAKSILASRVGSRWPVEKSNGPAIAALASWHARAQNVSEKYRLTVSVNDQEIETLTIDPATDGSRRVAVPAELLRADRAQRIEFKLDGRATFSYSAVLTGFVDADKIASTTDNWKVTRRYEPAKQVFDGRVVPRGFVVVNGSYKTFTNPLTQLPVGERCEVTVSPRRYRSNTQIGDQYDYLVLTEPIPAGCTVLESSVSGQFERFEIEPGQITFHIGSRRSPSDIRYTLLGYVPGTFRAPQSILRSFYEPSRFTVASIKELDVLKAGEKSQDDYRLTPDELYYLGTKEFDKKNFDKAHQHLSQLYEKWRLDNDENKNTVTMLFSSSLAKKNHGDSVKYFEVLKEKFPEVEISFNDILSVAKSYRELGEYERSYLVYRATVEASFERESQVAGFLDARGEFVRSVQAMERLLRDYPAESYVATASYALAQETFRRAPNASKDKKLKAAGINRVHLVNGAIEMLDHFVTGWPEDPSDDQASFALATALLDLEKYDSAIERSGKYAERYPESRLLDSFWYMIGYSHFELEHPKEALKMCQKVADATFPSESGGTRPADNRWEAIYIMGQVYHSLGQAGKAIAEYARVKERFADATEAINFFSRKEIALDEVTTIKPADAKKVELRFRNVKETAIKVYRIDLMKFGLMQRNLDRITAINLAGIKPYHEETVALGDGKDFRDREKDMTLPLKEEGAYLIVCRSENLYASGLALVSPLDLLVQEDVKSGRVRVSVKETTKDKFVGDVHVKVIGSANNDFESGETDLRGLFIADNVKGTSTVIAVAGDDRYAFYRGKTSLQNARTPAPNAAPSDRFGAPAAQEADAFSGQGAVKGGKGALRDNLFNQNGIFQMEQKGNYDGLMNNKREGVKSKEAY